MDPALAGPDKPKGSAPVAGDLYRIAVVTSDKFAAATDATVRLALTDVRGQTWQPCFPQTRGMFDRHKTSDFEASTLFPMDELASCRVWLDPQTAGMGDDWHLDRVVVSHLPSNRTWLFVHNDWITAKKGAVLPAQVTHVTPR